jgi:voltage-gated sodium channel
VRRPARRRGRQGFGEVPANLTAVSGSGGIEGLVGTCGRIARARWFQMTIIGVIIANAVTIGLETYDSIEGRWGEQLDALDTVFLAIFVVEIAIRIVAHGRRPQDFFRSGWNVFDFVVVGAAFVPGLSANSTVLRMIRVLRIARLISVVPDLRVILRGLFRSIAPLTGVLLLTFIVMYVYAILGWVLFGEELPERWGTAGEAMLTMFELLTLEGWNEIYSEARDVTAWAIPYFITFILLGTFVVLNLVIAVVINSVEEARAETLREEAAELAASGGTPELASRLQALRQAMDDLEQHIADERREHSG